MFDCKVSGTFPTPGQKTVYVKVYARVVNPEQGYIGDAAIGATRQALEFPRLPGDVTFDLDNNTMPPHDVTPDLIPRPLSHRSGRPRRRTCTGCRFPGQ